MPFIRRWLFGIDVSETHVDRRGFQVEDAETRSRLERIGSIFVHGYLRALEATSLGALETSLVRSVPPELMGFAFEGAAMGLGLLDLSSPWRRRRVAEFLEGPAEAHTYLVHVGVGWALARWPMPTLGYLSGFDPLLRWLAFDGWGFHQGFFHWKRFLRGQPAPAHFRGYAGRVFDQGLGRSLWFSQACDPVRIQRVILEFSDARRADLWSGVGLAAVYAGEVNDSALEQLIHCSGDAWPSLAQGAVFAAKARQRAGNLTAYAKHACAQLSGCAGEDAALMSDAALENLPADGPEPAYEIWRRRIQKECQHRKELRR